MRKDLAIAYNVAKKNRKKMYDGGGVSIDTGKTDDFTKGFKGAFGGGKADGGMIENEDMDPTHDVGMRSRPEQGMMMHGPKSIAIHIHTKRMARGGMADECYEDGGPVLDPGKVDKFTKGFGKVFATGGEVDDNEDSEVDSLPYDDHDDVGIPALGYDSAREDIEGQHDRADEQDDSAPSDDDSLDSMEQPSRKGTLKKIMRGLHMKHMGR